MGARASPRAWTGAPIGRQVIGLAGVENSMPEPDGENNVVEIITPISPLAKLELEKRGTTTVYAGAVITYTSQLRFNTSRNPIALRAS